MRTEIEIVLKNGTKITFEDASLLLGMSFATVEFFKNKNGYFDRKLMYDLEKVDTIKATIHNEE